MSKEKKVETEGSYLKSISEGKLWKECLPFWDEVFLPFLLLLEVIARKIISKIIIASITDYYCYEHFFIARRIFSGNEKKSYSARWIIVQSYCAKWNRYC